MTSVNPENWEKSAQLINSWPEIAAAIRYEQLTTQRQAEARDEFFKIVIQPQLQLQLGASDLALAKAQFEREVEDYLLVQVNA